MSKKEPMESINIRVPVKMAQWLRKQENYSEYIRHAVEREYFGDTITVPPSVTISELELQTAEIGNSLKRVRKLIREL